MKFQSNLTAIKGSYILHDDEVLGDIYVDHTALNTSRSKDK